MNRSNVVQSDWQGTKIEQQKDYSLAVVIPTVGCSKFLYSAIQSVFDQECLPDQIVLVWNGCSPPDWFICVERLALVHNISLIQVHHNEQIDISTSWASGAHEAKCDLLLFLGDDDLVDRDFISLAREKFKAHPLIDVFSVNARYIDNLGNSLNKTHVPPSILEAANEIDHVNQKSIWFAAPPPIFASVFRREKLGMIGFFPYPGFAFDVWMFHHLALEEGYYLCYVNQTKMSYRRSTSSASNQVLRHSLDYISGLLRFECIFRERVDMKPFRVVAANFALTAIAKSKSKPFELIGFAIAVIKKGFALDLIIALINRVFSRMARVVSILISMLPVVDSGNPI